MVDRLRLSKINQLLTQIASLAPALHILECRSLPQGKNEDEWDFSGTREIKDMA